MEDRAKVEASYKEAAAKVEKLRHELEVALARLQVYEEILGAKPTVSLVPTSPPTESPSPQLASPPRAFGLNLKGNGPTEAVWATIQAYGLTDWLTAGQIRDYMTQHGYLPAGKTQNFAISVNKVLARLRETEEVISRMENGQWLYRAIRT